MDTYIIQAQAKELADPNSYFNFLTSSSTSLSYFCFLNTVPPQLFYYKTSPLLFVPIFLPNGETLSVFWMETQWIYKI